jgi:lipopolysaccharide/colanic/teichoic acid biosynthesis glycosyltransferase
MAAQKGYLFVKTTLDFALSFFSIICLLPLLTVLCIVIISGSHGAPIYTQIRVGKNGKPFLIYKLRSMYTHPTNDQLLTVGMDDKRITPIGKWIRKYKIDELPQLLNVLKGNMSIVGPRPEVPKYVAHYTADQLLVLTIKPGITDYASIKYSNENQLLAGADNPEDMYLKEILSNKLELNLYYLRNRSLSTDFKIMFRTVKKIWG